MTRSTFHHETLGQHVLFGAGLARTNIALEVERLEKTALDANIAAET